ncbi:hypothetical protein Lal_00048934 [Lupinus albus]|nr:hypothetical protein Lal_00048934 [Lupinus albus]
MRIFSLYFPLILSFLSFLDSTIKKHIHSFIGFATTINTTRNIATDEHKLHLKSHRPISASATTHTHEFMSSTESLGFDSIDERLVNDHIDHEIHHDNDNGNDNDNDNDDDDGWCYDLRRTRVAEGRQNCYPPLLSSLNRNGRPSFFLRPVRKNGRLILTKVRMKSHEMIYASRENGRLRLYLVPDDDDDEEQEELVGEIAEQKEEEMMVDSDLEEDEEDIEEDRVGEWNYGNEGFRRLVIFTQHVPRVNKRIQKQWLQP